MVLESVIFGLVSALGVGISDLIAVAVTRRLGVLRTVSGIQVVSVLATTPYLVFAASLGDLSLANWGALAGLSIMGSALLLSFYKALQLGPVAIVSPVVSSNAVVVVILAAVFVGERLSGGQLIGVTATIGGVILASVNLQQARSGRGVISKGVVIALIATVGVGVWIYSIGVLSRELGWFLPVYVTRLLMLGIYGPTSLVRREWPWQRLTVALSLGVVAIGILETGSLFAFARGAEVGIISIVAAASTTYPIVPIVGGMLIFRERLAPSQLAGLPIVLAGLVVLGMSA